MATIDIGKLTFTHKGDYAGGTAYVLNDVVYYNGSAYVAKTSTTGNLPTSTAHWNNFATGSGGIWNSGLSIGSAGQAVKVNAAANALEFGTISSDYEKLSTQTISGTVSSVNFDNTIITSNHKTYVFTHEHVRVLSGNADIGYRCSTDNGSSFPQHYGGFMYKEINGSDSGNGASYSYHIAGLDINTAGNLTAGTNTLLNASSTSSYKGMVGLNSNQNYGTSSDYYNYTTGSVIQTNSAINYVRFFSPTGSSFDRGIITCYGIKQ
tara:strand:- start:1194 stop:1988 length:795 start_codon:yes stop_codon:yes gene_type:complete